MFIRCSQEELSYALSVVARALPIRGEDAGNIPDGVLLTADSRGLTLTVINERMGITTRIDAQVKEEGVVLIGRIFNEVVRHLPKGEVTLERKDTRMYISAPGSRIMLSCREEDTYPLLPSERAQSPVILKQQVFRDMVRQTAFAASMDLSRPILTGVYLHVKDQKLTMVSLDGFRLALRETELGDAYKELSAVVPASAMTELSRIAGSDEENIDLTFTPQHLIADMGETRFSTRLLKGEYINYAQLLTTESQTNVVISRMDLVEAVERASAIAQEARNNLVKLTIRNDGGVRLHAESEMGSVDEDLDGHVTGRELEIAFNSRYIGDVIKNLSEDSIKMCFNTSISPCVIRPVTGTEFLYLVLPVRVSI
ncbi:MAG: DNA polymerase III subunit beta [Christensenellales bacterium]|jgi:DNA polymerase-3 subunit beta